MKADNKSINTFRYGNSKKNVSFFLFQVIGEEEVYIETELLPIQLHNASRKESVLMKATELDGKMRYFLPTSWILEEWEGDLRVVKCVERFVNEITQKIRKKDETLKFFIDELEKSHNISN